MARTQKDRDEDLALGRELERKDAEIGRLRADLAKYGDHTQSCSTRHINGIGCDCGFETIDQQSTLTEK